MNNILNFPPNKKVFTMVSLFAGAGGLDMGFENQGFKTIWVNDIDKDACSTHRLWSDAEVVQGDIRSINFDNIPKSDIIAGGFPCQGFSLAGPRKIDDKRNMLYRYFVKLVDQKQPYAFVAENVKGLLTLADGEIMAAIVEDFSSKGYVVTPRLVNAADYGVPQDRWRVLLVGLCKDLFNRNFIFPEPLNRKITLREALKDMPEPTKEDVCHASFSSRYMSRNRKRTWDQVSYTIPAMSKQVTLHPSSPDMLKVGEDEWRFGEGGNTRRFSWREAAVIQTFPKEIEFVGNLTSKYKQIGNAVPVKLAEAVAQKLYSILEENLRLEEKIQRIGG